MATVEQASATISKLSHLSLIEAQLAVTRAIYEESQLLVPVDKGDLKESGKFDENSVEYGTDHAVHIEFGTVKMKAQPYLRPAVENNRAEIERIAAEKLQRETKAVL